MKYLVLLSVLLMSIPLLLQAEQNSTPSLTLATYRADWLVVGAGPAGIATIAALLDAAVKPENIIWVDDAFKVGALGKFYRNVPPNSSCQNFFTFFNLSTHLRRYAYLYRRLTPATPSTRTLLEVIKPLQKITDNLRLSVANVCARLDSVQYDKTTDLWHAFLPAIKLEARNVILATGSSPKSLQHEEHARTLPLHVALNKRKLQQSIKPNEAIAVFGSSHSAALVLKHLIELGCNRIFHIYKYPFRFRKKTKEGFVYPFSGLQGEAGKWASHSLPHPNITSLPLLDNRLPSALNECSVIIDAIGFEPSSLPVRAEDLYPVPQGAHELGPRLYGVGIAFPDATRDASGHNEGAVSLLAFMRTLKREIPRWIRKAGRSVHRAPLSISMQTNSD